MAKLTGVSRDWVQLAIEENTRNLGGGGVTVSENISQIGGVPIAGGQAVMAASLPVVIASDQSAIPVTLASSTVTYTPVPVSIGASASSTIPATAKSWSFVLLTGTGTLAGVAVPLGVPLSGGALTGALAYTTASASSALAIYETSP